MVSRKPLCNTGSPAVFFNDPEGWVKVWEGGSTGRGYGYTNGQFTLFYNQSKHVIKQLYTKTKNTN